ncbi:MAG: RDD family protein [Desulfobacterales bacterium]|nr:MAG: RDD family protein [Desulfobacterales bacterium]
MEIYYAEGNKKVGPIGKAELQTLIKAKKVTPKTLVWQPGMDNWKELGVFVRSRSGNTDQTKTPSTPVKRSVCSECGKTLSQDEMIRFQDSWVCGACKPLFIQKIKEGVSVAGAMDYAGFWIRFGAILIDGLIMWIFNMLIFIPMGILMPKSPDNPFAVLSFMPLIILLQYAIPAAYDTWFVGKYGATPGKMACKLKIVVADGSRLSYLRAFGRHFAKWLSSMILLIGFIMAAFDEEKRTLHDRICETRVVRK